MEIFGLGIDRRHRAREFFVDTIIDRDGAEVGILAVEPALRRLVGMLEPVIADERFAFAAPRSRNDGSRPPVRPWVATIGPAPLVLGSPESTARNENSPIRQGFPDAIIRCR